MTSLGEESSVPDLLGESILQNQLTFELGEDDEIYEGYGKCPNAYPYRQRNGYSSVLKKQEVQAVVLENDFLKAVFLPEYGGRLWELWDKQKGENILYTNDVLQFRNLAVRNAWFSGGVEWNIGIIGHSPFTTEPLYVAELEDEKGNPVLRMYEHTRIRKVIYQMDFWLEEDSNFLNCRMRIVNDSPEVKPMYWWSNMAVPEYHNGRVIVPADTAFTCENQKVFKVDIPMVHGQDVTDYERIPKSVDYFFDVPEELPKFIANVNENGYGLLHVSTKRLKSRKLFTWGHCDASDRWQEFLTDKAGKYLEIQAGLGKTQYGCIPMAPHTAWEWMEQYGAVQMKAQDLREKTHEERYKILAAYLQKELIPEKLEKKLKETKKMAKMPGKLILSGSSFGVLHEQSERTSHLEFTLEDEAVRRWKSFLETGILGEQNSVERPDEFWNEKEVFEKLKSAVCTEEKDNWYAWYQLGLGYYIRDKYEKAKEAMEISCRLTENAWALHGLACIALLQNQKGEAARYMKMGIRLQKEDKTYLKDGFKILFLCKDFKSICECYEMLCKELKNVGRLKFYFISALHELGENERAYELLEENGGLELEDVREGEDSITQLWCELHEALTGEIVEVPHFYNFMAFA